MHCNELLNIIHYRSCIDNHYSRTTSGSHTIWNYQTLSHLFYLWFQSNKEVRLNKKWSKTKWWFEVVFRAHEFSLITLSRLSYLARGLRGWWTFLEHRKQWSFNPDAVLTRSLAKRFPAVREQISSCSVITSVEYRHWKNWRWFVTTAKIETWTLIRSW